MSETKNKPGIHLYKDYEYQAGKSMPVYYWYWHIVSKNGRIIARSSETYSRKSGAVRSIKTAAKIFQDSICEAGTYKAYYDHSKKDSPLQSYL